MIIEKVELENFISHKRTVIDFEPGVTVIVGPNGAGKTSIVDAISFALLKEHSRGTKLSNLVNRRALSAKVRVYFLVNGIRYMVERSISKSSIIEDRASSTAYLYKYEDKGLRLIARGDRTVHQELQKILGINPRTLIYSVIVRQGEIEQLITAQPWKRKEIISSLLGLSTIEKVYERMREIINHFKHERDVIEKEIISAKQINEFIKAKEREKEELKNKLNRIINQKQAVEAKLKDLKKKYDELDYKKSKYNELSIKKAYIEKRISELQKELTALNEELEELKDIDKVLKDLEVKVSRYKILRDLKEQMLLLINLKDKISKVKSELSELRTMEQRLQELREYYNKFLELKEKLSLLEQKVNELKELKAKLDTINGELVYYESEIKKKLGKINTILFSLGLGTTTIDNLHKVLSELHKLYNDYKLKAENIDRRIDELKGKLKEYEVKINEVLSRKREILNMKNKCPLCLSPLTPKRKEELLKHIDFEHSKLRDAMNNTLKELSELDALRKKIENRIKILEERIIEIEYATKDIERNIQLVNKLKNEKKLIEEELLKLEEIVNEYNRTRNEVMNLEPLYYEYLSLSKALETKNVDELKNHLRQLEDEYNKVLKHINQLMEKVNLKEMNLEVIDNELNKLIDVEEKYVSLKSKAKLRDERLKKREKLTKELESMNKELKLIEQEINSLSFSISEYKNIKQNLEEINKMYQELLSHEGNIIGKLKYLEQDITNLKAKVKDVEKLEKKLMKLNKVIPVLERIRKAFSKDGLQKLVRAKARRLIETYTREFLERFNLDLSDIKIDEDFNITLIGPHGEHTVDQISGGERIALAIALRMALARTLVGYSIESMILDEPTVFLDEYRRRELIEILKYAFKGASKLVPQLIVVSHDRELEEAADVIYTVDKEGGYSIVRKVK